MTLRIPPGPFRAYLFDCDGTIADTMPLHYRAWSKALEGNNCEFSEADFYAWAGMPVRSVLEKLAARDARALPFNEIIELRESAYLASLSQVTAVREVLEQIHAQRGKIPSESFLGVLVLQCYRRFTTLGLTDTLASSSVRRTPRAENHFQTPTFLRQKKIRVSPADCLVFEDGDLGIESAKAAGMQWVKIEPPHLRQS